MALVECKAGATTQTFDGVEYTFKKDRLGRFVCNIPHHEHVSGFIANSVYQIVDDNDQAEADYDESTPTNDEYVEESEEARSERLAREADEAAQREALEAQAAKQKAQTDEINAANAEGRTPNIEVDPYTKAQMPTVDPTRTTDDGPTIAEAALAATETGADEVEVESEEDNDEEVILADDLTVIDGIGEAVEKALNNHEIYTFEDLAGVDPVILDNLNETEKFRNGHKRWNWQDKAKELAAKAE